VAVDIVDHDLLTMMVCEVVVGDCEKSEGVSDDQNESLLAHEVDEK
jgi:hypothetical protein